MTNSVHPRPHQGLSKGTQEAAWRQRLADLERVEGLVASGNLDPSDGQREALDYALLEARNHVNSYAMRRRRVGPF